MSLEGLHVLLAEDNPTNQMVAVQMLETLGATVTLAVDGEDALLRLREGGYDVGLIDIEMPRVSGIEVIRRVRAGGPPQNAMPLIALTAYVMREHHIAIDEAGADGVIAKPILSIEQLGRDILGLMRRRAGGAAPVRAVAAVEPCAVGRTARAPEEVIDFAIYEGLESAIGESAMRELLFRVAEDLGRARERIETGLAGGEERILRDATHALTSVAGAIGALRLQQHAQCLNSAAHAGDIDKVKREGAMTISEIDRALRFVRSRS